MSSDSATNAASPSADVPVAKLHVLQLGPIKAKLGDKWARLSELVHKLFERALANNQGPMDHFIRLDELCYIVSFHGLSQDQANLACTAVAQEVCEHLFGNDIKDVSVRTLIGSLSPESLSAAGLSDGHQIETFLERHGQEKVIHPKAAAHALPPAPAPAWSAPPPPAEIKFDGDPLAVIAKAQALVQGARLGWGFLPIWDLQKQKSYSLFLTCYPGRAKPRAAALRPLLNDDDAKSAELEIALLNAAHAYSVRVYRAHKVCGVAVGVGYETLAKPKLRARYLAALKAIHPVPSCPLLLKIEQVPEGVPLARLGEIIAMLHHPAVRVVADFRAIQAVRSLDVRLGAHGIGHTLDPNSDPQSATAPAHKLMRLVGDQKMFAFIDGLDKPAQVEAARANGIRFGIGAAIAGERCYLPQGTIPDFPLVPHRIAA